MNLRNWTYTVSMLLLLGACSRCDRDNPKPDYSKVKIIGASVVNKDTITGIDHTRTLVMRETIVMHDTASTFLMLTPVDFWIEGGTFKKQFWNYGKGWSEVTKPQYRFFFEQDSSFATIQFMGLTNDGDTIKASKKILIYDYNYYIRKLKPMPYSGVFSNGSTGNVTLAYLDDYAWYMAGMVQGFCSANPQERQMCFQVKSPFLSSFQGTCYDTGPSLSYCDPTVSSIIFGEVRLRKDSLLIYFQYYHEPLSQPQAPQKFSFKGSRL